MLRTALSPKDSARSARRLKSSGGTDSLLPRVRAVLLFLQHGGHPDLILADVPRITNYWMKTTGASESASRGVPEWLRSGSCSPFPLRSLSSPLISSPSLIC
jgi:hypothetical protein